MSFTCCLRPSLRRYIQFIYQGRAYDFVSPFLIKLKGEGERGASTNPRAIAFLLEGIKFVEKNRKMGNKG